MSVLTCHLLPAGPECPLNTTLVIAGGLGARRMLFKQWLECGIEKHRPCSMEVSWAHVSIPPQRACSEGEVWTWVMWHYCTVGLKDKSLPCTAMDGRPISLVLAFAERRLETSRKPSHMLLTLPSPQHTPSLLATGPSYQLSTHLLSGSESPVLLGLIRTRNLDPLDRH